MRPLCLLVVIFECIGMINTYECYLCISATQPSCGDPFDANAMTPANKVEAKADEVCMNTTTNGVIVRQVTPSSVCSQLGLSNGCQPTSVGGVTTINCCCSSNLCNGVLKVGGGTSTGSNGVLRVRNPPFLFIIVGALALIAY